MQINADQISGQFCVAGISYKTATAAVRGAFSINEAAYAALLDAARLRGLKSVFVVSTCNRTEIYGYADHPHQLAALLIEQSAGSTADFFEHACFLQGKPALNHLFRVAAGLESQLVGDYEIQGQIKKAYQFAMQQNMVGPIMDRTVNFVFQASKKIRTQTLLSNGTVSVSYAAIEWLQKNAPSAGLKILVIGTGKLGRSVCKNILHYLPGSSLSIMNRTNEVSQAFAAELGVCSLPYESLAAVVSGFDVILLSTQAAEPILKTRDLSPERRQYILDLSVPANAEAGMAGQQNITLVNVDDISAIMQKTIASRKAEIPRAEAIIEAVIAEFHDWLKSYRHSAVVKSVKDKLLKLYSVKGSCEMAGLQATPSAVEQQEVQKMVSHLMVSLRFNPDKGCQLISAYQRFFENQSYSPL